MSSPQPLSAASPHIELSSSQANLVYWLNGLAPVATNIVTPLVAYLNLRKQPQTLLSKYNMQVNEVVRQLISGTVGLVSYFGGGELTRGLINSVTSQKPGHIDEPTKQVAMIAGGVTANFIGFAFVRPYISTELICKFLKREESAETRFSESDMRLMLKKARTSTPDTLSHSKVLALLKEQGAAHTAQLATVQSKHWLIAPIQRWIDYHLVPNGVPNLTKVARYSTFALTSYLTLLTLGLWGLNRLLGKSTQRPAPQQTPASPRPLFQNFGATTHKIPSYPAPQRLPMAANPTVQWAGGAMPLPFNRSPYPAIYPIQPLTQIR